MKPLIAIWLLASVAATAGAGEWKLVWSDEFDRPGLPDPARWSYETGYLRNHERQFYTRARQENARVEGGMLIIEARKERYAIPGPDPSAKPDSRRRKGPAREFADYTSASLTTDGKAAWIYGRIEVCAQAPLRARDLAGDLDPGDRYRRGRLAPLRRDRHHGVRRLRTRDGPRKHPHV